MIEHSGMIIQIWGKREKTLSPGSNLWRLPITFDKLHLILTLVTIQNVGRRLIYNLKKKKRKNVCHN